MNIALIFAGGVGRRMKNSSRPKQFLELSGKPIIIHTIEHFENHEQIDGIVVVCISEWISYLHKLLIKYNIKKVLKIVEGGSTGQKSIRNGLFAVEKIIKDKSDCIVLIHDGVRPLIDADLITANIESVKHYGNGITVVPAVETIIKIDGNNGISEVGDRSRFALARAPQSFFLKDILEAHKKSLEEGIEEMIDSAMLMNHYGIKLHAVVGPVENIKITTRTDYYLFRAFMEAKEDSQFDGDI